MLKAPPFNKAILDAQIKVAEIKVVADRLAELMKEVHGGSARVDIKHDAGMILITTV
ncbi:hypothetical protein ACFOLL_13040 [Falsochrobactrum ovis]|uniref:Uncharacterized protein n=1 Tax=Falsochrobactrum ovis TaxID=1293442 RepID=A0A364JTN7_9HYPH|nr:hypothetical protein [Falsochrobactrum ovis]RAK27090.1 hypothetical protein C7374_11184 [Falsochrobactrum ovis]